MTQGINLDPLLRAIEKLADAVQNEGSHPAYHRQVMVKHRNEWPTLWRAIQEVLDATARLR